MADLDQGEARGAGALEDADSYEGRKSDHLLDLDSYDKEEDLSD